MYLYRYILVRLMLIYFKLSILLLFFQIVDIITSFISMHYFFNAEANPLLQNFWVWPLKLILPLILILIFGPLKAKCEVTELDVQTAKVIRIMLFSVNIFYVVVIVNNFYVIWLGI